MAFPVYDEEGVYLGMNTEIGEAVRGLSGESHVGAAQRLAQARGGIGNLAQAAANRFNPHAPLNKVLRSPYKDGTQIAIKATGTILSTAFTGTTILPTVTGATRLFQSFKPEKAIASELLIATWTNDSDVSVTTATSVTDIGDLVLIQAYSGSINCFPNAPNEENGIPGCAFARDSLGNGISWPTLNTGVDMNVSWAVESSILYRMDPPTGYVQADLVSVAVTVRLALFGPSLR